MKQQIQQILGQHSQNQSYSEDVFKPVIALQM